jgi:hypothetical protein
MGLSWQQTCILFSHVNQIENTLTPLFIDRCWSIQLQTVKIKLKCLLSVFLTAAYLHTLSPCSNGIMVNSLVHEFLYIAFFGQNIIVYTENTYFQCYRQIKGNSYVKVMFLYLNHSWTWPKRLRGTMTTFVTIAKQNIWNEFLCARIKPAKFNFLGQCIKLPLSHLSAKS